MIRNSFHAARKLLLLILSGIVFTTFAAAQDMKIQGLIVGRSGATMTVKTQDSETIVVALTPTTQVDEVQGLFKLRKKELGLTALIPGLPVQVKGNMNDQHQLVADSVKFKGSDLRAAQDIQAGLAPTQQQVDTNQKQIAANQSDIEADQAKIAVNKQDIEAANKRFGELGDYNVLDEATVYFANGQVDVEAKYKPQLIALAQKALTINAYIIEVQGYASSVGSVALNQKLSMERANNVLAVLEQDGNIPLTNILAPGAMGSSNPVASNETTEGQAENRRVIVRVLQNKGISGT